MGNPGIFGFLTVLLLSIGFVISGWSQLEAAAASSSFFSFVFPVATEVATLLPDSIEVQLSIRKDGVNH